MRDYLRQLKLIEDNLGICGEKISDAKHIAAILNGLPSEFDSVVTLIISSKQAYDVPALSSILIDLEARQKEVHFIEVKAEAIFQTDVSAICAFVSTNGSSASVNALLLESMSGFLIQGPLLISLGILSV
ncbi:hypothetical protein Goklo_012952 [Gossypium klotzschianum]|uniref:Uncharacterized protein n=1 Tax=Gossypium klotzschianum TaxID=34286 RepID=A0A7J8VER0_9ROSI|nr:hypothetical protein [Gossypium klotzschianum]